MSIQIGTFHSDTVVAKNRTIGLGAPMSNTSLFIQPTSAAVVDLSANNHTLSSDCTFVSNPHWTGKYMFQASGSKRYINGPTNNQTFNLGSSDFTVETILTLLPHNNPYISYRIIGTEDSWQSGWSFQLADPSKTGTPNGLRFLTSGNDLIDTTYAFAIGQRYHLAASRKSNTFRLFINGTQVKSRYLVATLSDYAHLRGLSRNDSYRDDIRANLEAIRIVKGVALYESDFIADTTRPMYLY